MKRFAPLIRVCQTGCESRGEYRQLNGNVLQIENVLYAPIRPKRVTESGERLRLARAGWNILKCAHLM